MPLEIILPSGQTTPITLTKWDSKNNRAIGTLSDNENSYEIEYPLPIIQDIEDFNSCKIFLFKNRYGSKEDQLFELYINSDRRGIIFPIKVFSHPSFLPNPNDNKFIFRFLFIAYYHLLNETIINKGIESKNLLDPSNNLKIEDFYDDETIVMLYHNSDEPIPNIDIRRYYPSLFKFGYVPITIKSDFDEIKTFNILQTKSPLYSYSFYSALKIVKTRSKIYREKYINQIFEQNFKYHLTPLSRFILLYQIIELLIDKIAVEYYHSKKISKKKTNKLIKIADKAPSFRDVYDSIKSVETIINSSIGEIKNEEKRINILFNICKLSEINYQDFINFSKLILNKKSCKNLTEYVYLLRNNVIHNYHNLSSNHSNIDELLFELNLEFEKIICDIIIEYERPTF